MFERFIDYIIFIYQISQNMYIPPLPRSSLRPLRGSAIHSSAASSVLVRRPFFIPLIHLVWAIDYIMLWEIDWIIFDLIMSERLITLWLRDWIHYFYLSNLSEHVYSSVYSYPATSSLASPVHSYGGNARPSILSFYWSGIIILTYYRVSFIGGPKSVT